jgi:hypothetical protein
MLGRKLTIFYNGSMVPWEALEDNLRLPKTRRENPGLESVDDLDVYDDDSYGADYDEILERRNNGIIESKNRQREVLENSLIYRIAEEKSLFDEDVDNRLSYILETFSESECENPRDKIYGILGLVPEHRRVQVDYAKPLQQIFFDVLYKVIEDEWYLDQHTHRKFASFLAKRLQLGRLDNYDLTRRVRIHHSSVLKFQKLVAERRANAQQMLPWKPEESCNCGCGAVTTSFVTDGVSTIWPKLMGLISPLGWQRP